MSEWILALEGTPAGGTAAIALALAAALLHAIFGALQKGRHDPWISRAAIDVWLIALSLPAVLLVPWPEPHLWPILAGAVVIHFVYKVLQALAYSRGAYTVVYPVVRGTGPLFTVLGAWILFGETFSPGQWAGLMMLVAGIFGLAAYNYARLTEGRATLGPAMGYAVATGLFVALYTTYDAWGIRSSADPFTFLAWFFLLTAFDMPLMVGLTRLRARLQGVALRPLLLRGLIGALVAFGSFGGIMLATRLGPVGQAAVLRETSTVFAALIGWLMLGERTGPRRVALMAMIAGGAVVVQLAG
jgi:multidrug transporter EmrE-like cation transporter